MRELGNCVAEDRNLLGLRVPDWAVSGPQVAKTVVGHAFERIAARVLGGVVWDERIPPFWVPAEVATESDGTAYGLAPDVWWSDQCALVEVKSGVERFFTTERQWASYLWARDTTDSGLPVDRPRVFYAFLGYRLSQRTEKYRRAHALLDDALARLRYFLVADSKLVAHFIGGSTSYQPDRAGPLSPLLGIRHAHWNLRVHRLQQWAEQPRKMLQEQGMARWGVWPLAQNYQAARDQLVAAGWPALPTVPALVLHPRRPRRVGPGIIPGSQLGLFNSPPTCPRCNLPLAGGTCTHCGAFAAF